MKCLKKLKIVVLFFSVLRGISATASVEDKKIVIPSHIKFADMHIVITSRAKVLIQQKINTLIENKKSFNILLNRVLIHMPIVEKTLEESGVPQDFKYIPIQESGMISVADDTYSRGFWQFKDYTAKEVSLEMSRDIDSREHIVESTRGAAKYLKANNIYCRNWLVTLLAFNRGRGWVEQNGYKKYRDQKKMTITHESHWYIIHFIAHMLVFQEYLKNRKHPSHYLHEHINQNGDSIADVAKQYNVSQDDIMKYNTWIKNLNRVSQKSNVSIIIPLKHGKNIEDSSICISSTQKKSIIDYEAYINVSTSYPEIHYDHKAEVDRSYIVNGLRGTIAIKSDSIAYLCSLGRIQRKRFIIYNDIDENHTLKPGKPYYFEKKNLRGDLHIHVAQKGETWWSISQKYGVLCSAILKYNRKLDKDYTREVPEGRIVFLRSIAPKRFDFNRKK